MHVSLSAAAPLQVVAPESRPTRTLRTPFAQDVLRRFGAGLVSAHTPEPPLPVATLRTLHASAKGPDLLGADPLHEAVSQRNLAGVQKHARKLAQEWPDAWNGQRALTLATMLGYDDVVGLLLKSGADPNGADVFGNTPLHWATFTEQPSLATRLCEKGANPLAENIFFGTPQHYAAALGLSPGSPAPQPEWQASLGLRYLPTSTLTSDFALQMLLVMVDERLCDRIVNGRPKRCAPATPVPLRPQNYGGVLGWGVCAPQPLQADQCIGTYTGELVHTFVAQLNHRNDRPNAYLAEPLARTPQAALRLAIDASSAGNLLSRINGAGPTHAANLQPRTGWRDGLPVLDLWTTRPIGAGEQLLWDYGDAFWKAQGIVPQ